MKMMSAFLIYGSIGQLEVKLSHILSVVVRNLNLFLKNVRPEVPRLSTTKTVPNHVSRPDAILNSMASHINSSKVQLPVVSMNVIHANTFKATMDQLPEINTVLTNRTKSRVLKKNAHFTLRKGYRLFLIRSRFRPMVYIG